MGVDDEVDSVGAAERRADSAVKQFLAPHDEDEFLAVTLGRTFLHIPGHSGKFSSLPSWSAANRILSQLGIYTSRLRVILGEAEAPAGAYCRNGFDGFPRLSVAEVNKLLREGAALALDSVEDIDQPTARLCRSVERWLRVPLRTQLCADMVAGNPRKMRWNDHEAFILHLAGRKLWHLHEPTLAHPTALVPPPTPAEPSQNLIAVAGDLLYLPRGWWYTESSLNEPTLFLTLKFRNPTGFDLVATMLQKLGRAEPLRRDIPRFANMEVQGRFLATIQREVYLACGEPGFLRDFLKNVQVTTQPVSLFGLAWSASPSGLTPTDSFEVVPLPRFFGPNTCRHSEDEAQIEVLHEGQNLRFEEYIEKILEELRREKPLTISELVAKCSTNATRDQVMRGLSSLVIAGLVTLRDPHETDVACTRECPPFRRT